MPSEEERHLPPKSMTDELGARLAAQVADDQAVLAEARELLREITDAERDQLRDVVRERAAMSVETSNAPGRLWALIGRRGHIMDATKRPGLHIDLIDGEREVEYLRADLVVPTVDEIAQRLAERRGLGRPLGSDLADAKDLHEWLLSRIEGDNDEQ